MKLKRFILAGRYFLETKRYHQKKVTIERFKMAHEMVWNKGAPYRPVGFLSHHAAWAAYLWARSIADEQ